MTDCTWQHPYGLPDGARQYLIINSINAVTLESGAPIVLQLDYDDYLCSTEDPLGYDRYQMLEHEATAAYSASGVPVVSGGFFIPKYGFTWSLRLNFEKASILKAIYDTQQVRWRKLRTDYAVRLLDARLMLQEPSPRTRAALTGVPNMPNAPTGAVFSYAIFDVILKRPDDPNELLGRSFQKNITGTIEALELDFLGVENDTSVTSINPVTNLPFWDASAW